MTREFKREKIMKKFLITFVLILLVFFLPDCSKKNNPVNSVNPDNPTLTGSWKGTARLFGVGVLFIDTDLSQDGTSISGNSKLIQISVKDTLDCTVSGNNNYPNVNLTFQPSGSYQPMTFTGSFVTKDSLSGKLNGSGANNWDMDFVKK